MNGRGILCWGPLALVVGVGLSFGACSKPEEPTEPPAEPKAEAPVEGETKRAPGDLPFDYGKFPIKAEAGQTVLTPNLKMLDRAFEKPTSGTYIFYRANLVAPGEVASKVKSPFEEFEMPNALIVPIRKGEKVAKGDILLCRWTSGSGMQRCIVTGGTDTAPVVRYLDMNYDNPAGIGKKDDTLKPDEFHKLTTPGEVGTAVAYKKGTQWGHGIVVHDGGDKKLLRVFAGKLHVAPAGDVKPIPLKPEVKVGDEVWAAPIGSFAKGKVTKVDPEIGRVWVERPMGSKTKTEAFAFGSVLTEAP